MKNSQSIAALAAFTLLSACAIRQDAVPVMLDAGDEICVIHDPAVRAEFEPVLLDALEKKGFATRVIAQNAKDGSEPCAKTLKYTARWSWDFTIYMSRAELYYSEDGGRTGQAIYDSKSAGGLSLSKWVNAEEKLREMVDELFPS